ncbi:MAG TPA: 50S ribosomal protein L6 [Longimicrobiales bacterium]|nr:50S ribosomal protein L6 [Longimicrobiales bacterium]
MSRIGRKPIPVPAGVTVTIDGHTIRVKGPKGELQREIRPEIGIEQEDGELLVTRPSDSKEHRAFHGLTRALVANMVEGVTTGFRRTLEIIGVGYRAEKKGDTLVLTVGYSHQVKYPEPDGIALSTTSPTVVVVEGIDKAMVGQVAAEIRAVRPPEPYKGKGIRYQGEQVRRKAGKAGAK